MLVDKKSCEYFPAGCPILHLPTSTSPKGRPRIPSEARRNRLFCPKPVEATIPQSAFTFGRPLRLGAPVERTSPWQQSITSPTTSSTKKKGTKSRCREIRALASACFRPPPPDLPVCEVRRQKTVWAVLNGYLDVSGQTTAPSVSRTASILFRSFTIPFPPALLSCRPTSRSFNLHSTTFLPHPLQVRLRLDPVVPCRRSTRRRSPRARRNPSFRGKGTF